MPTENARKSPRQQDHSISCKKNKVCCTESVIFTRILLSLINLTCRIDKPKADTRLLSFLENDVPEIVRRSREKKTHPEKSRPLYSDIGVFLQGVIEDLNFVFPDCKEHKDVLIHAVKTLKIPDSSVENKREN